MNIAKKKRKLIDIGLAPHDGIISIGISPHGFISIGAIPHGVISIGLVPMGVVSLGLVSMGLVSFGSVSMGLVTFGKNTMSIVQPHQNHNMPSLQESKPETNIHDHHDHTPH